MKTPGIYLGALTVFCIAALVIGTTGASAMTQQGTGCNLKGLDSKGLGTNQTQEERMTRLLDNLTEKGFDVSAIRTAVESGDATTAHTLMQEFRTAHPDAFPVRGDGPGNGHQDLQARTQNIG